MEEARAHVPLGFDATAPIACVSSAINDVDDVKIYMPSDDHPKGLEALSSLSAYLSAVGKPYEVVKLNPCSSKALFEVMLNMRDRNLICGGSGLRALGALLIVSCLLSKSKCLLVVNYEGGGPCLRLELGELEFERREEALAYAYLALKGEATLDEMSNELGMNKKSLWRVLGEMSDKGLVKKVKRGTYALVYDPRA